MTVHRMAALYSGSTTGQSQAPFTAELPNITPQFNVTPTGLGTQQS